MRSKKTGEILHNFPQLPQALQARAMDPQQRLLLETSMNGLLDSGLTKAELMGSEAGRVSGTLRYSWSPQITGLEL